MSSHAPHIPEALSDAAPAAAHERTLWEGAPTVSGTFWQVFRARWLLLYLGVLCVFRIADALAGGAGSAALIGAVASVGVLSLVLGGLAYLFARWTAHASAYSITAQRVVIKLGVALPMTIDLPLALIDRADLRRNRDGSGDIVLTLHPDQKVSYIVLWPHVLPFHFLRVRPTLRALPDVDTAAEALANALGTDHQARTEQRLADACHDAAGAAC